MKTKLIFAVIVLIVAAVLAFDSFYIVNAGEQAIVERFGAMVEMVKEPGIKTKIPILDRVVKMYTEQPYTVQYGYTTMERGDTQKGTEYATVQDEAIMLTKGSYLVNVEAAIQLKISDLAEYYYNVDDQVGTLRLAFEGVMRRNVQSKDLDDALLNKEKISSEVLPELKKKINEYGLGYEIKSLEIQNISVPDEVGPAYDDVNNAKNEKSELEENAKKYANEKLPNARAEAYKMIQEAEAYRAEKVSQAKGDVENFNQVYEKYKVAKGVTRTRLRLETMEKVLQTVKNKVIIDVDSDGIVKYMPVIPQLQQ
jgi:membrane protease subunit HflK